MVNEEYKYSDISDYLDTNIDLLIAGFPGEEERSKFFSEKWKTSKRILYLKRVDHGKLEAKYIGNGSSNSWINVDLCIGVPELLKEINVNNKNVLVDISSLDNVLIMSLTKHLLTNAAPKTLFAAYIRPEKYKVQEKSTGYFLSEQVLAMNAVPCFAKRRGDNQILCAFLGFEGKRLKALLESGESFAKIIPIVAFPSGTPEWYNVAMMNSMDVLQSFDRNTSVYKCFSESIFDAVKLLGEVILPNETVVITPLGTRPHSMACAIFACSHPSARIVYDFVVEDRNRAMGISEIIIYHLSSYIK